MHGWWCGGRLQARELLDIEIDFDALFVVTAADTHTHFLLRIPPSKLGEGSSIK